MPTYGYVAVYRTGGRVRASREASSESALARALLLEGLVVLRIREQRSEAPSLSFRPRHASHAQVLEATRALASLAGAGMPLARALRTAEQIVDRRLIRVLSDVRIRVERGASLGSALEAHSSCFNSLYTGAVRAGERSGDLPAALLRLSQQLEREGELRARLLSASIYPLLLAGAGSLAVAVLLTVVLPRFAELLVDSGAILPRSTVLLMNLSQLLEESWLALAGVAAALGLFAVAARAHAGGQRLMGRAVLALPLLGSLKSHALAGRFARTTGVLMIGGATLFNALQDVADSSGDVLARDEVLRIRAAVREGMSLGSALSTGVLFPPMLTHLAIVGEESGSLDRFLIKAADLFEDRVDRIRQRLVALAEPVMILVFGGIIGFVALSMLQAVYSVNASAFR
jgi:type II secretory pathway component PulF